MTSETLAAILMIGLCVGLLASIMILRRRRIRRTRAEQLAEQQLEATLQPNEIAATESGPSGKHIWRIELSSDQALFRRDDGLTETVPQSQASAQLVFSFGSSVALKGVKGVHILRLKKPFRRQLRAWTPRKTLAELKQDLRSWGIGLILLGAVHLLRIGGLTPILGIAVMAVGALSLVVPHRYMFVGQGIALLLISFDDFSAACSAGSPIPFLIGLGILFLALTMFGRVSNYEQDKPVLSQP